MCKKIKEGEKPVTNLSDTWRRDNEYCRIFELKI